MHYGRIINEKYERININARLKKLYQSKWDELILNAKDTDATYPLLIKVDDSYKNADIRVMIVGQETDGWCGVLEDGEKDIDSVQESYFNYLYKNKEKYRRPFWNRKNFRYFEEEISKMFPDKKVAFIWNNVSKIGKNSSGKPTKKIEELEKNYFDIFEEEFALLNPSIVIFTTGNRTIPLIHKIKKSLKEEPVSKVLLKRYPSIVAVRTYHPNAQIKGGKKRFKEDIIDLIKSKTDYF